MKMWRMMHNSPDIMLDHEHPSRQLGLFSFADEGSKQLAGTFFQASLLPYLIFLYFLAYSGNRIAVVGNFGFQYLLLFVAITISAGIVAKNVYGYSLADVDWLHGLSESLLTVSNLLIVCSASKITCYL